MKPRQTSAAAGALRPRPPAAPPGWPPEDLTPVPKAGKQTESACNPSARVPQLPLSAGHRAFKAISPEFNFLNEWRKKVQPVDAAPGYRC